SFRMYNSDFSVLGNPEFAIQFFYLQTGRFLDGSFIEYGGTGLLQGTFPYPWFFPTNPNDLSPGGWSEVLEMNDPADRRGVGSSGPYLLDVGQTLEFDQAFCFFQDENLDHIETVDLLYAQIPQLQSWYDNDFTDNQAPLTCTTNCIWPGDANQDGIVDGNDLLRLTQTFGQTQTERDPPSDLWAPYEDPIWSGAYPDGISYSASDCNGSGTVSAFDTEVIRQNFKSINANYQGDSGTDIDGPELYLEHVPASPGVLQDTVTPGSLNRFNAWLALPPEEQDQFAGISFEVINTEGLLNFSSSEFNVVNSTGFDQHLSIGFGPGRTSIASISADGSAAPPQALFFLGRFSLQYDLVFDQCAVELNLQNVQAIRTDGTFIPIGNVDRIWASQCLPTNTIEFNELENDVSLFPNPSSDVVRIESQGLAIEEVEVFDHLGRLLPVPLSWDVQPRLAVSHLPKGIYVVRVQTNQGEVVKRLMVQ
ncbi:MAG: T9SS type A sorting domain-containing protein, partial [Bacteroidota bacterium]